MVRALLCLRLSARKVWGVKSGFHVCSLGFVFGHVGGGPGRHGTAVAAVAKQRQPDQLQRKAAATRAARFGRAGRYPVGQDYVRGVAPPRFQLWRRCSVLTGNPKPVGLGGWGVWWTCARDANTSSRVRQILRSIALSDSYRRPFTYTDPSKEPVQTALRRAKP